MWHPSKCPVQLEIFMLLASITFWSNNYNNKSILSVLGCSISVEYETQAEFRSPVIPSGRISGSSYFSSTTNNIQTLRSQPWPAVVSLHQCWLCFPFQVDLAHFLPTQIPSLYFIVSPLHLKFEASFLVLDVWLVASPGMYVVGNCVDHGKASRIVCVNHFNILVTLGSER